MSSSYNTVATNADVDTGEDGALNVGDVVQYSMRVSNPGNTCLMDIAVRDKVDDKILPCDESYKGQKSCVGQVARTGRVPRLKWPDVCPSLLP